MKIIGRKEEMRELERLTNSGMPEFVAVYGRRRVGKTFLVKEFFGNNFVFYTTGVSRGSKVGGRIVEEIRCEGNDLLVKLQ